MNIEEQLAAEALKYETFAKRTKEEIKQTNAQIAQIMLEIQAQQSSVDSYKLKTNTKAVVAEETRAIASKKHVRRVQSLCAENNEQVEHLLCINKNNTTAGSGPYVQRQSMVSERGTNPSTTDASLVINNKSGVSGNKTELENKSGEFGISAKLNNFSFVNTSGQNSHFSGKPAEPFPAKVSRISNKFASATKNSIFRISEEKLLTFSNSIQQVTDSSVVLDDIKLADAPASKVQRHTSCQKIVTDNSAARPKSKHRVRLPVTFTNLDEILNIDPHRSQLRSKFLAKMGKKP